MESIYTGICSIDGYVFITNDVFGETEPECAIVRINQYCGALIVTARGNFLRRATALLATHTSGHDGFGEGLSADVAANLVEALKFQFKQDDSFSHSPLPFLLLLVGCDPQSPGRFSHVFVRNRVTDISEKNGEKQYVTAFDVKQPVVAGNLFYGHGELSRFLAQQLPADNTDVCSAKLLGLFAMQQTQAIDGSMSPAVRMAILSHHAGFSWINNKELQALSEKSHVLTKELKSALTHSFATTHKQGTSAVGPAHT